jgi:GAF domain-containing protein
VYKFLGLYLLIIIGLFIEFSFLGTFGNIVIKILILSSVSYFLYEIWRETSVEDEIPDKSEQITEDYGPDEESIFSSDETVEQEHHSPIFEIEQTALTNLYNTSEVYRNFLINQFSLVWDYIYPKNGYIIYRNKNEESCVLHRNIQPQINAETSQNPSALFTLIDNKDGILIENNIEQTLHLIPFYKNDEYKPKSLLGFASRFESGESFYWVFDSDLQDTFNLEDLKILERVNSNSEVMTIESLQNFGLNKLCRNLNRKLEISTSLNMASSIENCLDHFCDFIVEDFEATKLTIAMREDFDIKSETASIYKVIGGDDPFDSGFEFPLDQGLNGWVILKNKPHLIENIEKGEYFVPRFSEKEKTNYGLKSYLSVPIPVDDSAIGMVTLEDKLAGKFTRSDKTELIEYTELLSKALKRFEIINNTL